MQPEAPISNEQRAAAAFTAQAPEFDAIYQQDTIIQYKRKRVHDHVCSLLPPSCGILELNAGTGEDAIFFAQLGHHVHATDISEGMQQQLRKKVTEYSLNAFVTSELCSFTNLKNLQQKGPYDFVFSNFAGLNCTNEIPEIISTLDPLLKPGGVITWVLLPPFCLWELLLVFKGKFATATRRFFSSKGRKAKVNGIPFTCWYHSSARVKKLMKDKYEYIGMEGLCTIVPPSYIEHFAEKHPKLFAFLVKQENKRKAAWPWKNIGDYYIISFRKK